MNIHDEYIKKAYKEIDKLTADIEKKKIRITDLKATIKQHESEKARDSQFSESLMKLMSDNGIVSDNDRKTILLKFEELMLNKKSENFEADETVISVKITENNNSSSVNYKNPAYLYKPTDN